MIALFFISNRQIDGSTPSNPASSLSLSAAMKSVAFFSRSGRSQKPTSNPSPGSINRSSGIIQRPKSKSAALPCPPRRLAGMAARSGSVDRRTIIQQPLLPRFRHLLHRQQGRRPIVHIRQWTTGDPFVLKSAAIDGEKKVERE
ncbi:hypothetical protein ACLOJK_029749 [Asimina triloba]